MKAFVQPAFKAFLLLFLCALGWNTSTAQSTTLSTAASFSNNNGSGIVTFNFQNSNPYPIIITDIEGVTGSSGTLNASLWYNTTPIAGAPGIISAGNGWTQAASGTFTGTSNTSTTNLQPILSNISVTIPANTTYGFAVYADGQRYFTMSSAQSFTAGGVTFLMGPNMSYGGGSPNVSAPSNTPRGWIGSITFKPAIFGYNNAALSQLTSPVNFCQGSHQIKVKVQNSGHNMINTVSVNWELNGTAQTPYNLTTPLDTMGGTGINEVEIILGTYNFAAAPVPFKAWTTMPNGVADTVNGNDTITTTLRASLSGTYTINDALPTSGSNYNSFGDFIDDLEEYGVCGPVIANVAAGSGPYNEYVVMNHITGTSATNTIRINGNGATVQFSNTSTQRQLLTLSGAKYTRIDSLTFKALSATYGWGALLTSGCEYDSLTNCIFDLSLVTTTSSVNASGIAFSASTTSATSFGANGNNCFIANNQIKCTTGSGGPYYCLSLYGDNMNNIIRGNTIENYYIYGIYNYGGSNNIIENNDLNRATKTSVTTFYGIYASSASPAGLIIRNNRIHRPYGGTTSSTSTFYGIMTYFDGTATDPVLIYNNAIYDINQGGTIYGLYGSTVLYTKYYHNTVTVDNNLSSSGTNYGIYLSGTNTGTELKNNIVNFTAGGTGTKYGFYYSTIASADNAQKNNIFMNSSQSGTQNYGYYGSAYNTQAAFQAAFPAMEVGSPAVDPQYVSAATGDFTPNNGLLIATGANVYTNVTTDINGLPRTPVPTIGAFERPPVGNNNAGVTVLNSPSGNYCPSVHSFNVTINNFGVNNIDSVQINWKLNGVLQTPYHYVGTLTPATAQGGQSYASVTIGTATVNSGANALEVWTSLPNGQTDSHPSNDSLITSISTADFSLTSGLDTICLNGVTVMNLSPNAGYNTGALQWEYYNGTNWVTIPNTDTVDYSVNNLLTPTDFRVHILTGGTNCYSPTKTIQVLDIAQPTGTGDTLCGPGTLTLTGVPSTNANLKWYEDMTTPTALASGNSFTTPYLTATTTYYIASAAGAGVQAAGIDTPASTSGNSGFSDLGLMFDATIPFTLLSVDVYPYSTSSTSGTVTIALKNSSGTVLQSTTANVIVGNPAVQNTIPLNFSVPAGTDMRLVVTGASGISTLIRDYGSPAFPYDLPGILSITSGYTSGPSSYYYYYLYNWMVSSGCESLRIPITATINDNPVISLGPDLDTCIDVGAMITLDPGVASQPANTTYLWNNNTTNGTLDVGQDGTYSVAVTNVYGCVSNDTINVNTKNNPVVDLGANGNGFCVGATKTLDAGPDGENGGNYYWNTGATTRTLTITGPGTYIAYVTSSEGCLTIDTVDIVQSGYAPTVDGILAMATSPNSFNFNAVNPQNVVNYEWDFGDGTPVSTLATPSHTYTAPGNYTITLKVFSVCADIVDSSTVYILGTTGTNDLNWNKANIKVYPNPSNGQTIFIEATERIQIKDVVVYNTLGQEVLRTTPTDLGSKYSISLPEYLSSGMYQLHINTDKGATVRKLELVK